MVMGPVQNLPFLPVYLLLLSQIDDQSQLAWVAGLETKTMYLQIVTNFSTYVAHYRATSLMRPTVLPLSHAATDIVEGNVVLLRLVYLLLVNNT